MKWPTLIYLPHACNYSTPSVPNYNSFDFLTSSFITHLFQQNYTNANQIGHLFFMKKSVISSPYPLLLFLLGSSARSPDRGSRLRTSVKTQRNKLHNRNCTIVRTKCSNPYNVGWGVFIPPNPITSYQKCPSGSHEGQEIILGVFGNFPKLDSPT